MGGWTSPTTNLTSGTTINPNAPLSTLLPKGGPAANPDVPGTSSSSNLQFQSNAANTAGNKAITSGISLLGQPLDYWQKLLQPPTRTSLLEQEAPAVSSVIGQYSTGKNALTQGPRGGGTTAEVAELPFQESGAITGLLEGQLSQDINTLQPEAAQAITGIANTLSGLGLSEIGLSSQDLTALITAQLTKSGQTLGALSSLGQGIGSIIGGLIAPGGLLNAGSS